MSIHIAQEQSIQSFRFYFEGKVHQGMSYENQLYKLVKTLSSNNDLEAYRIGQSLSLAKHQIVVTVSQKRAQIWVDLKTQRASENYCFEG